MKILHLRHNEIDRTRWDATIAHSLCDLPYAYSWYLDVVCLMWEALATEDYAFLMPLPLKKKWGISYLIHPIWVQQLGLFSAQPITPEIFEAFRRRIPYLVYDFNINYLNSRVSCLVSSHKTNLIISYNKNIDTIRKDFNSNTKRNIAKAHKAGLTIRSVEIEQFVVLWKAENSAMRWDLHATIESLIKSAFRYNSQFSILNSQFTPHLLGVYKDDQLIAALFGMQTRERFIYLIPVSNQAGKEHSAMFLLVDYILENICCQQGLVFDCEGSMIPGVARFYQGFGAKEQPYTRIQRCHPQWLVRLLHK